LPSAAVAFFTFAAASRAKALAQGRADPRQRSTELRRLIRRLAQQLRTVRADLGSARAMARDQAAPLAALRTDRGAAGAAAGLDPRSLAQRMEAAQIPQRAIARLLDMPESTVRGWLKAATNGHHAE